MSGRGASGDTPIRGGQSLREKAGHLAVVPKAPVPKAPVPFDAVGFAAAFPGKWQAYLRENFDDPVHVARAFRVSERAARKWWDGIGGPHGCKVAQARVMHPEASAMLFAA